ncbi:MAG: 3-methyl-2-oxobutanoate hydroxymethyltransferase [bacterium]
MAKALSVLDLMDYKKNGRKITSLTAYDYSTAKQIDEAGIDMILVGDSAAMVMLGYETTHAITMDEMTIFAKAVTRGVKRSLVVVDMPFGSYQTDKKTAVENACRLISETGAKAVKLEGGVPYIIDIVKHLTDMGIPVLGHLGFTPQYLHGLGGYNVQGKSFEKTKQLLNQALYLENAGAFGVVLEMVPNQTAQMITEKLSIPTIGIGAGRYCDGQILVIDDIIGRYADFKPKFARKYADVANLVNHAAQNFKTDVLSGEFPSDNESFELPREEAEKLKNELNNKAYF